MRLEKADTVEIVDRRGRTLGTTHTNSLRLPFRTHGRRRRRAQPGVDREQPVLVPRVARIELDATIRQPHPVEVDPRTFAFAP